MKIYKVKVQLPERELEFRITCTSFSTAAARAIKEMRKHVKGKRFRELSLNIVALGAVETTPANLWPTETDIEQAPDFQITPETDQRIKTALAFMNEAAEKELS